MNKGRIEQVGDPEHDLPLARARSFVADFLGAANIVEGTSLGGGNGRDAGRQVRRNGDATHCRGPRSK